MNKTQIRYLFLFRRFPFTQVVFLWTLILDPHSSGSLTVNFSSGAGKDISVWLARSFWVLLTSYFNASTLQQRWDLIWHKSIGAWTGDVWSIFLGQTSSAIFLINLKQKKELPLDWFLVSLGQCVLFEPEKRATSGLAPCITRPMCF